VGDPKRPEQFELAYFRDLSHLAVTFAFELHNGAAPKTAFRLGWIHRMVSEHDIAHRGSQAPGVHPPPAYEDLIDPIRSFHDDVTTGDPGVKGRPLIFLASGAPADDPSRVIWLRRPARWEYRYEGLTTGLTTPPDDSHVELRMRDAFCLFESGRLFYVLSLTPPAREDGSATQGPPGAGSRQPGDDPSFDEYVLIQLQQIALDHAYGTNVDFVGFARSPSDRDAQPLFELVSARLHSLAVGTGTANGITDVITPFGLLGTGASAPAWDSVRVVPGSEAIPSSPAVTGKLRGMCVAVASDEVLEAATWADKRFSGGDGTDALPDGLRSAERNWSDRKERAGERGHDDPENDWPRALLAFAGVAQGVPDFPWQDESEIYDSTRPVFRSVDSASYIHPKFMLEVAKSWRSFDQGRPELGTCPYLLLMWLVAVHDELLVGEMEERLEAIIYGAEPAAVTDLAALARHAAAEPMHDVHEAVMTAKQFRGRAKRLEENLRERLEIFRWLVIHRSGNAFRYEREKGAMAEIQKAMGTTDRFDEVLKITDRIEALVEDAVDLKSSYAQRRTNTILLVLALMTVLSVSNDLYGYVWRWGVNRKYALLVLAFVVLIAGTLMVLLERVAKAAAPLKRLVARIVRRDSLRRRSSGLDGRASQTPLEPR